MFSVILELCSPQSTLINENVSSSASGVGRQEGLVIDNCRQVDVYF